MYLVELKPGKEELYRTGDELALAIRDGDVDARSRIYHRATAKWISITLHPQYKAIIAGHADEPEARSRHLWGLLPVALASVPAELSSTEGTPASAGVRHRWKRPMGLGFAGLLLLLGIQLAFSGPRPPWAGRGRAVVISSERTEKRAPSAGEGTEQSVRNDRHEPQVDLPGDYYGTELVSLASTTGSWPVTPPSGDTAIMPVPAAEITPILPRAPRLRPKALRAALAPGGSPTRVKANSVQALLSRYESASDKARSRLESGMRAARLQRLFAPARLTPGGGVTDTRLSLAGATHFIRVYRQQQVAIDKAYQDSVTVMAKRQGWGPQEVKQWHSRPPRNESPALELLSGSLLSGIDSILGVLDAQAGAYKLRGTAIAFEDPAATQAYAALRRRIKEQIEAAVTAGGATSLGPTGVLLQSIGTSTLPRET